MRDPKALWRELGSRGFFAFQIIVAGTVLLALVHPWFYVLAAFDLATRGLLEVPESRFGWPFWLIACFDLSVGYLARWRWDCWRSAGADRPNWSRRFH